MEISNTKLEMPKWVCALAIALGSIALAVQCVVDIYQGISSAMDRGAFLAQVWQMSLPTGFTLVFAAMAGCLWRAGGWKNLLAGAGLFGLVIGYMTYTALNSMDFLSDQTVARTQAHIAKQTQAKDIAEIKNKHALDDRKELKEGLWRSYVTAKSGTEKDKALAAYRDVTQESISIERPDVEVIPLGVGGTAQKYLGWRPEAIQEVKAVAYPVLVMIGKMLGITLGFAFWPTPSPETWKARPPAPLVAHTLPESVRKLSYDDAKADLLSMIDVGARIDSQRELSERWGVGEGTVSKWLPRLKKDGVPIRLEANGNKRAIVGAPRINGNGRVAGTA